MHLAVLILLTNLGTSSFKVIENLGECMEVAVMVGLEEIHLHAITVSSLTAGLLLFFV